MKYIILVLCFFISIGYISNNSIYASNSEKEEQACLNILKDAIRNDGRFSGINIEQVKINEWNNQTYNISNYRVFKEQKRRIGNNNGYFIARRNNIGTIIRENDYIITQFVTFWDRSSFKFPLPTEIWISRLGDDFGEFRDKLIYTHHLYAPGHRDNWVLLSCGFLKLEPKPGFGLADLHPDNYMSNDIMESGFELVYWPSSPKKTPEGDFIVGKVRVPVKNWPKPGYPNGRDLMNIELITVAFNNESELFNEYETFPLQVRAMTDMDINPRNVATVQERFLKKVKEETCLRYTHAGTWDLPGICDGTYKSLSKKILPTNNTTSTGTTSSWTTNTGTTSSGGLWAINIKNIFVWWFSIPTVHARLDPQEIPTKPRAASGDTYQWIYYDDAMPYSYMEKLDIISDPHLKDYIRMAILPGFEKILEEKKTQWLSLTEYEEVFLSCDIPYSERVENLKAFLQNMDPERFDATDITYLKPKIGDCIIPLPDKRHRNLLITGSFLHNQKVAATITNNTEKLTELEPIFHGDKGIKERYIQYIFTLLGFICISIWAFFIVRLVRRP